MKNIDMFWASNKEWFDFDDELFPIMNDNAPKEAIESYNKYMELKGYTDYIISINKAP